MAGAQRALRAACRPGDVERKLEVVRAAVAHHGPTCDIDQMLAEIGQAYLRKR